jgi:hypothetical protein
MVIFSSQYTHQYTKGAALPTVTQQLTYYYYYYYHHHHHHHHHYYYYYYYYTKCNKNTTSI